MTDVLLSLPSAVLVCQRRPRDGLDAGMNRMLPALPAFVLAAVPVRLTYWIAA